MYTANNTRVRLFIRRLFTETQAGSEVFVTIRRIYTVSKDDR